MSFESIGGIILASGLSRRFGRSNKLLVPLDGLPVVARTVAAYVGAGLQPVLVVIGHQAEQVREALREMRVEYVFNPSYEEGQSRSLVHGLRALPAVSAAVIGVGDQPFLTSEVVSELVALYRRTGAPLVAPRYSGVRGNPVLFDRALFAELLAVTGDVGGRPVLQRHTPEIAWLDIADPRIGADFDTPEEFRALQSGL